jgi:hypothetical protein
MIWLVGSINKHIVHDSDGSWVGTFKDENVAAEVVSNHNLAENRNLISVMVDSEAIDTKLATSNGWTNSTKGWAR